MQTTVSIIKKNSIPILFFLALFCNSSIWSNTTLKPDIEKQHQEKVYVLPEQIVVTPEEILAYDIEGEIPMAGRALSFDEKGLYLKPFFPERGPCGIHSRWCKYCRGCGVLYCPMKCECPYGGGG